MIIDVHNHPFEGVPELMEQGHISRTVLLPGRGQNELVLEWAAKWPGKFIPFYWAELDDPEKAADDLDVAVKEKGHKGIKFQPLVQRFYPNEKRLRPLFARAEKLGIPVLFHSGVVAFDNHYAQYGTCVYVDELAGEHPELKIIIAHLGGNYDYEALVISEKNPNVYMDTAYQHFFCRRSLPRVTPMDRIKRAVEFAGPHKVLYGSEGTTTTMILDSDLDPETKKKILWQNAERVLGVGPHDWTEVPG